MGNCERVWQPIKKWPWGFYWGFETKIHERPAKLWGMSVYKWFIGISYDSGVGRSYLEGEL